MSFRVPSASYSFIYLFIFNKFIYFIFGCVGSLLLYAGFSLVAARRLLIAVASPVAEHGL